MDNIIKIHLSPQKENISPQIVVQKYPNTYQSMKNDHVEKEEEGKKIPSQERKERHLHQRKDVCTQYCHLDPK